MVAGYHPTSFPDCLRACLKSAAGLPAGRRGGSWPAGKTVRVSATLRFYKALFDSEAFSAGLEARLYVSQDGRRYSFQTGSEAIVNRSETSIHQWANNIHLA